MATFELYRRSTIGMPLTDTLDEMVSTGNLALILLSKYLFSSTRFLFSFIYFVLLPSPAYVLLAEALDTKVRTKVSIKDALFKYDEIQENVGRVKIVACDSKLLM
ncbi:transcription initiation factor IIA, gamma subunit [Artemisia annua]|uniref:Transcription initiation factor IIA, gamma subunit n=1 Tax=Artemisia annua TaxID=35608 RepID=A0A2U1NXU0_ARTAN|nr:transcription initiation factor IIA, gamma subunit [Artemisia annua]